MQVATPNIIESKSIPEPNSGCWLWLGTVSKRGYGKISSGGKIVLAHRASWCAHKSEIPVGMSVCHRCDNPCCVNPDHLFLGTHADNMRDKVRKNRQVAGINKGATNGASKLTEEQVIAIRASTLSQRALAAQFGVNRATIHFIRAGITWAHLPQPRLSASLPSPTNS